MILDQQVIDDGTVVSNIDGETVSSIWKNLQTQIPIEVIKGLDLNPGDQLVWNVENGRAIVTKSGDKK